MKGFLCPVGDFGFYLVGERGDGVTLSRIVPKYVLHWKLDD